MWLDFNRIFQNGITVCQLNDDGDDDDNNNNNNNNNNNDNENENRQKSLECN